MATRTPRISSSVAPVACASSTVHRSETVPAAAAARWRAPSQPASRRSARGAAEDARLCPLDAPRRALRRYGLPPARASPEPGDAARPALAANTPVPVVATPLRVPPEPWHG